MVAGASELVGRDPECALIDRLLAGARRGESGTLVLRGEAGMGKSALLGYAVARSGDMTELALAGVHGLLRPIVDRLQEVPEPQRPPLAAALGLASGEVGDRFLVSAGVLSLLAAAAECNPVLCVIDDAQWLDAPSAHALSFVARRLVAEEIAIVFSAREGEHRRFDSPGLEELHVLGIDRESAGRLLDYSAPGASPSVRSRLIDEASGNPLALLELPARLTPRQLAGQDALPEALPLTERLRGAFAQRIERLPEVTRSALLVAAAEETGELAVTLRASAELGLPPDALDAAEGAGLVRIEGAELGFRHPLVRSVLYESAPLGRRRQAHAALAAALDREQQTDRAVWHHALATPTSDAHVADAMEAFAQRSQLRGGHASAVGAFERAAALSTDRESRGRRLAAAVNAAWLGGQVDRARELVRRALPVAERDQRARLLFQSGVIEGQSGWLLDGVATVKQAVALSDDPSLTLEILREGCAMAGQAGAYEDARAFAEQAAGVSCVTEIDRFIKTSLLAREADLSGDYARGKALSAELSELAEPLDVTACVIWAALGTARAGLRRASLHHANRAVGLARDRGEIATLPFCLQAQAAALIAYSRLELAYASSEEGWRLAVETGRPWAAAWNVMNLALVDALRGAEEATESHVAELRTWVTRSGATTIGKHAGYALALLHLGCGRPAEALDQLLAMISATRLEYIPSMLFGLPDAVEAAVRTDRADEIAGHLERFRTWARGSENAVALALLARCEALLDDRDAEPHWQRAGELADALPPVEQGRTELLYGEWLRRQRRRVEARRHLRAALDLFGRVGLPPWEARARAELRASGETARKRDPSTRDHLTPQELQIARLVATGKSNPEVAAQLFLSPRTIDYHLRKVYAKLEISSRADLTAIDLGEPAEA
jgi:DNA-binding CsgD family transcriptional regulator